MSPLPPLVVLPQDPTQGTPTQLLLVGVGPGVQPRLSTGQSDLGFPCGGDATPALRVGLCCNGTTLPPCAQPCQANRALLPLRPIPEAAGFPEQGHCGSHWSPLANKTHRCRERAHKTGHPPQRVCALCHPHPTQGWARTCKQCGSVPSLCRVWEGSRAPPGSQGACSSWDTPALPLAGPGGGSSFPSAQWLTLTQASAAVHTSQASSHSHRPRSTGCPESPGTFHRLPHTGSIRPQAPHTHTHTGTHSPPLSGRNRSGCCWHLYTPHGTLIWHGLGEGAHAVESIGGN